MSLLALLLPPRERLSARAAGGADAASARAGTALKLPSAWSFVYSADGRAVTQQGNAAPALLPRADQVVLVLAEGDVSWHRVELPKAPPARLRAALLGVMEEGLLEEDENLHFALAAGALPGQAGWVAVTHRPRLAAALAALEGAGLVVERVVAVAAPPVAGEPARGHFHALHGEDGSGTGADAQPRLSLALPDGVATLRLHGALARALQPEATELRWTATPAAAAAAERWLGAPVALLTEAGRALEAAQGSHNLRQFDLAVRMRGTRALRGAGQRFLSREWRPVRLGLAALVGVQLLGLNVYAWQQRQALEGQRAAMKTLLTTTHPGVRAVLDAPLQMRRETERLRAAAGRPGDGDLEALMGAAAAAWPDGQGPVQTLSFDGSRLSLAAPGFGAPQLTQMQERLRGSAVAVELSEGLLVLARQDAAAAGRR